VAVEGGVSKCRPSWGSCVLFYQADASLVPPLAPTQAVCNDGSPGALYFHKAPQGSTQSNLWLFYLEGGDWCYDAASCATRFKVSPQFMTTNNWPGIVSLGGIFSSSPRKSPWAGANKIYVGYCRCVTRAL
jgi:Pectinacetylesterase